MLEKLTIINGNPFKLGFVDENSPKEWKSSINYKLLQYKELAYIDCEVKVDKILVVLELNPKNNEFNSNYIKKEIELFKKYYKYVLEDIECQNSKISR